MRQRLFYIFIICFLTQFIACQATNSQGKSCILPGDDFAQVENCLHSDKDGLYIAAPYISQLTFAQNALAVVYAKDEGWMYVNKEGRVIIAGVAPMDNGADIFHDGLVRFSKNKKWGFADEQGNIIIPPVYDGALNFQAGLARVCKGCVEKCVNKNCEQRYFSGGAWFYLNTKGKIVKK